MAPPGATTGDLRPTELRSPIRPLRPSLPAERRGQRHHHGAPRARPRGARCLRRKNVTQEPRMGAGGEGDGEFHGKFMLFI